MFGSLILYYMVFIMVSVLAGKGCSKSSLIQLNANIVERKKNNNKYIFLILLAILIISAFACIRKDVGSDYHYNVYFYEQYSQMPRFSFIKPDGAVNIEIAYYLLIKLSYNVFNSYIAMFFIFGLVIYGVSFFQIRKHAEDGSPTLMFLIFLILYIGPSFNITRQIMACSIVFVSYNFIKERAPVKFLLCILLAASFHTTALCCLPFYFLNFKTNNSSKVKEVIIVLTSLIAPWFFMSIWEKLSTLPVFYKYSANYASQFTYDINLISVIIRLPVFIPILISWKKLVRYKKENRIYILIYHFEFFSIILGFFMHWAFRLMYYCMISEVILIPQLIKLSSKQNKIFLQMYFVFYYLFYFYLVHLKWMNDCIFPFTTIWS